MKLLGNVDVSVHIAPVDARDAVNQLTKKITQYQSQYMLDEQRGSIYELGLLKKAVQDLEGLRESIQMNRDKLYYVTVIVSVSADSMEELEKSSKILEEVLAGKSIRARRMFLRQSEAFKSFVPILENHCEDLSRNFNSGAAASLFPFASPEFSHKKGIPLGMNLFTGSPVIFDNFIGPPFMTNYNLGIFATSGAGKSFLVKLLSMRGALLGIKTVFVDPDGEYNRMVQKMGGSVVKISTDAESVINPFDLEEEEDESGAKYVDIVQKIAEIKALVGMIVEGVMKDRISAEELAAVEEAVRDEYEARGINKDPSSLYVENAVENAAFYFKKKKEMPTLSSFVERLKKNPRGERIAAVLKPFLRGGTLGIFDGQTNISLKDSYLVNFDIFNIKDQFLRTYAMYVITNWVWEKFVKKDVKQKKRVVVDEAWMFMKYKDTAYFLENLSRRARKRNASLTVVSQSFIEFSNSPEGKAVLTNSAAVFLMKQAPTDIDSVQEVFHLSQGEREFLTSCGVGEALFLIGRNKTAIKVVASDYEKNLISTNPNE
ncbi:VirB4 family type IV secretion system protein [Caldanaerobacter subterraneus]|uniref:VirB4 family type IV secretion system protein n=1 Tax=Caldanaerobacter subterraneus TaxID=911092 RepID=UPI0004020396|nr:ATP-binding protein [Caldanaerobacter subterraneus]